MANKHFNRTEIAPQGSGRSPKAMTGKPGDMPFREKPGFPSAGLPGKEGPDRSAGVTKIKQHPKSVGL